MSALQAVFAAADERRDVQDPIRMLARRVGYLTFHAHRSDHSEGGFPDLVLVRRPRSLWRGFPWVVFVEAKRQTGRLTAAQAEWAHALRLVELLTGGLVAYRVARPSSRWEVEQLLAGAVNDAVPKERSS